MDRQPTTRVRQGPPWPARQYCYAPFTTKVRDHRAWQPWDQRPSDQTRHRRKLTVNTSMCTALRNSTMALAMASSMALATAAATASTVTR